VLSRETIEEAAQRTQELGKQTIGFPKSAPGDRIYKNMN